ncbi:MAG: endonuclease/exonuclease/phosphatase family protein [Gammaproteobacteria bacterium]|nr:endonuclease/exonuclease/phosphatase family protein [Gammaproteobacteria bacterium]
MKLITLNIWGGHVHEPFLNFIATQQAVDIICVQEVYDNAAHKISCDDRVVYLNILSEIHHLLPNHQVYFRPVVNNNYGIAILINKNLVVIAEGEKEIYYSPNFPGMGPDHSRNLQWLMFSHHDKRYTVINVHGLWNGNGKTDSPERLEQSQHIRDFMNTVQTPMILCGDFNLRPDTESLAILADGMNDQIKIHNIDSTRTSYYPKPEKYADYIFTSPDIIVIEFSVLSDEISDHAPLLLNFD